MPEVETPVATLSTTQDPTIGRLTERLVSTAEQYLDQRPDEKYSSEAFGRKQEELLTAQKEQLKKKEEYENLQQQERLKAKGVGEAEIAARQRELAQPFKPTQETVGQIMTLAGMLAFVGVTAGTKGYASATNANNAMAGVIKGYNDGRKELFDQQKTIYEMNVKRIKEQLDFAHSALERNMKYIDQGLNVVVEKTAQELRAKDYQVLAKTLEVQGFQNYMKNVDTMRSKLENQIKTVSGVIKDLEAALGAKSAQFYYVDLPGGERKTLQLTNAQVQNMQASGVTVTPLKAVPASEKKGAEQQELVRKITGANVGGNAPQVVIAATTMADGLDMAKYVQQNPEVVGRRGQYNQFINRYVDSFRNGDFSGASEIEGRFGKDEEAQKALRFAKRYAQFLTEYERALAGGAKGFTVALQQRYNNLLKSEQFNPDGFVALMNEHAQNIAKGASGYSENLNYQNLLNLGNNILSRSVNPERPAFQVGGAAPAPSQTGAVPSFTSENEVNSSLKAQGKKEGDSVPVIINGQRGIWVVE